MRRMLAVLLVSLSFMVFSADDELLSDVFVAQGEYNKCRALFLLLRLQRCHGRFVQ